MRKGAIRIEVEMHEQGFLVKFILFLFLFKMSNSNYGLQVGGCFVILDLIKSKMKLTKFVWEEIVIDVLKLGFNYIDDSVHFSLRYNLMACETDYMHTFLGKDS